MVFRDVRFCFSIFLLIVIAPNFSQNKDAKKWLKDDEVSTPNTAAHFRNRRSVNGTSTSPNFRQTTRYSIPPAVDVSTRRTTLPSPREPPTYNFILEMINNFGITLYNFSLYIATNDSSITSANDLDFVGVLMLEFLTMATTGNHFIISPTKNKTLEEKQLESAWVVFQLWLDLRCAEDIATIIPKVVLETVNQYKSMRKLPAVNEMHEILRTLFNKLNDAIEHNDFLSSKYKEERIRYLARHSHDADAQHKVYLSLNDVKQGAIDGEPLIALLQDLNFRKLLTHEEVLTLKDEPFLRVSNEKIENRVWVRTVLQVAKEECCISQMQNLYTAALNETVKNFDDAVFPESTIWFFADKLNKSVEADTVLKGEWTKQENVVREKLREARSEPYRLAHFARRKIVDCRCKEYN